MEKNEGRPIIPEDHPRAQSLHYRHQLVDGMKAKIVTPSGLCAHGRGEAFDYMFGEKTIPPAIKAMKAAIAALKKAKNPVISVNGNVVALVPEKIVELSYVLNVPLEINIFYQAPGRIEAIKQKLITAGVQNLLGTGDVESVKISNLSSNRRIVDPRGIYKADVVLIPLEDGDRAEALVEAGKTVIAIDLNPLSRTSQKSHITIVDNLIRVIPKMIEFAKEISKLDNSEVNQWYDDFDQKENLNYTIKYMIDYLNNKML